MRNRSWGQGGIINACSGNTPNTSNLPGDLLAGDDSTAHLKTVLNYLVELRTRWERGEPVSLAMLTGVYSDQVVKKMLLTCDDADAHLFSAPLHSLIAYCEQQVAEN
ncbi:hypothetical protein [Fibrella forsythiae]|uniref:Uncharacterized protein n=1 Tax=Fibrella forsythiae TaxID=2817061 RepID=A0ABS3JDU8_9BACT|nr:hypothetical protein [Fibrella forsythiae]MBO0948186.1 hypothetical protein [Fibrella forsythiae]